MKIKNSFVTNSSSVSFIIASNGDIKETKVYGKVDITNKLKPVNITDPYIKQMIEETCKLTPEKKEQILNGELNLYEFRYSTDDSDLFCEFSYNPIIESGDKEAIVFKQHD